MAKDGLRSTRFDFSDEDRDRLEFLRRQRGARSAADALRGLIREASDAAGYAGGTPTPPAPTDADVQVVRDWLAAWGKVLDEHLAADDAPGDEGSLDWDEESIEWMQREAFRLECQLLSALAESDMPERIATEAAACGVRGKWLQLALGKERPGIIAPIDAKRGHDPAHAAEMAELDLLSRIHSAAGMERPMFILPRSKEKRGRGPKR